jgi:hypothetical protein
MSWKPDYFRLFLSHVATQKGVAHELKQDLECFNISCFVAHEDIEPTREWQDEIEESLRTMDALAALLSPDFHKSNWTDQEVGFAVGTGRLIIPLRFGLDPYGFIAKYQGFPLAQVPNFFAVAKDIAKILARHGRTSVPFARAIVKELEGAGSYRTSKECMSHLEECPVLDEELLQRIEASIQNNKEVRNAVSVPERIQSLTQRHRHVGSA